MQISALILSPAFQLKFRRRSKSMTILTEKIRWISVVPRFALRELTLCSKKGDWIKGKSPAGNLVGCHPAFGVKLVKGFTLTCERALGLFQEPAHFKAILVLHSLLHTRPCVTASCTHSLISPPASIYLPQRESTPACIPVSHTHYHEHTLEGHRY